MNPDDYQKVKEIFQSVLEIEPEGRGAFLDEKCVGDGDLRSEVERLLRSYESEFLEQPAVANVADEIAGNGLRTGQQIGRYTILKCIGKGGMGQVYLAEDSSLARQVALKVLAEDFAADRDRLRRFEQEAKATSALNHPNILTVFEFAADSELYFLVSEFVDGQTLRQVMNGRNLSVNGSLDIAIQVATALDAAHRNGVIHRDIKPENIMLRVDGLVKVLDFGLAKFIDKALKDEAAAESPTLEQFTTRGTIMGTIRYMSPEQTRGQAIDARTDIWSLGCVLYEMLAGNPPFNGDTSADLIADIVKTHPIPLSRLDPEIPERLDEITTKALEKDPDERYQTTKDLLIDLRRLKRKYEAEDILESSNPELAAESTGLNKTGPNLISTKKGTKDLTTVSSAEYLIWGIKAHRFTAAGITLLVLSLVGVTAYLVRNYWRSPNEARIAYAANIRLAAEALETSNLALAKQLLDATRPKYGEDDLRDFEWGYLARLHAERMASQPITLKNEGWVNSVAFSADGNTLATGSNDARLWDVSTGQQKAAFNGHSKAVVSVVFSPDGTKLATGSFDKSVKVWDISSGQILWSTIESTGNALAFGRLAFSSDGNTLSAEGDDRKILTWDVATGKEIEPYLKFGDITQPFAVSPDGKMIAAPRPGFVVVVLEMASGRKIATLNGNFGFVTDVIFAPDSKSIFTVGSDKIAKLWSLPSGKELLTFADAARGMAFSPDGKTIAICSKDTIKLWDVEKGHEIASLIGHVGDVISIAFSRDGRKLASGGFDNTAKIWNVPSSETRGVLRGHTKGINGISFSPDSKLLASASDDKTVKIWDVETEQVRRSLVSQTDHGGVAAFSPDQRTIATIATDRMIKVWDVANGMQLHSFEVPTQDLGLISYSPNGKLMAIANFWDGTSVTLWDAATGTKRCSFPVKAPWGVRFSKDGGRVTASGGDKTVKLWNTTACAEIWAFERESDFDYFAAFMPDDKLTAFQIINNERSLKMIDTGSGKELVTFSGHDERLDFVDISPNGKRLVTADIAGLIKVWDIHTGQELLTIKTGIKDLGVALSPDGKIIAALSGDGTIRLFRAADFSR